MANLSNEYIYPNFLKSEEEKANELRRWNISDTDSPMSKLYHPYLATFIPESTLRRTKFHYTFWSPEKAENNGLYPSRNEVMNAIIKDRGRHWRATAELFNYHTSDVIPKSAREYMALTEVYSKPQEQSVIVWAVYPSGKWVPLYIPTRKTYGDARLPILQCNDGEQEEVAMDDWVPSDIYKLLWYDVLETELVVKETSALEFERGAQHLCNVPRRNGTPKKVLAFWSITSAPINADATKILVCSDTTVAPIISSRITKDGKHLVHSVEGEVPYPRGTVIFALYDDVQQGIISYPEKERRADVRSIVRNECQATRLIKHYIKHEYMSNACNISDDEIARDMFRDMCSLKDRNMARFRSKLSIVSKCNVPPCMYPPTAYKEEASTRAALTGAIFLLKEDSISSEYQSLLSAYQDIIQLLTEEGEDIETSATETNNIDDTGASSSSSSSNNSIRDKEVEGSNASSKSDRELETSTQVAVVDGKENEKEDEEDAGERREKRKSRGVKSNKKAEKKSVKKRKKQCTSKQKASEETTTTTTTTDNL